MATTRHILRTILKKNVWYITENTRQKIKRKKVKTTNLLRAIKCPEIREKISDALAEIAFLTLKKEATLKKGAHFKITVQEDNTS